MSFDPLRELKKINPSLAENMYRNKKTAFSEGVIPIKYKYLIAMALDASHGTSEGVATLSKLAIDKGANEQEIAEVLEVLHYICGGGSIYTASVGLGMSTK